MAKGRWRIACSRDTDQSRGARLSELGDIWAAHRAGCHGLVSITAGRDHYLNTFGDVRLLTPHSSTSRWYVPVEQHARVRHAIGHCIHDMC
jgi:hypothetical protein